MPESIAVISLRELLGARELIVTRIEPNYDRLLSPKPQSTVPHHYLQMFHWSVFMGILYITHLGSIM
jgi:hypothetical protein